MREPYWQTRKWRNHIFFVIFFITFGGLLNVNMMKIEHYILLYYLLLILDGNSIKKSDLWQHSNLIKCLKLIKWQRLLLMCAPISELPSNKGTMVSPGSRWYWNIFEEKTDMKFRWYIFFRSIKIVGTGRTIWINKSNLAKHFCRINIEKRLSDFCSK